jgi:hypothetical protein
MKAETIQAAIAMAAETDMPAVTSKAFIQRNGTWWPQPNCLSACYSSSETVLCGILLACFFEAYGKPDYVKVPHRDFQNSYADLVWPGGYWFADAIRYLTNETAWSAIKSIVPRREP